MKNPLRHLRLVAVAAAVSLAAVLPAAVSAAGPFMDSKTSPTNVTDITSCTATARRDVSGFSCGGTGSQWVCGAAPNLSCPTSANTSKTCTNNHYVDCMSANCATCSCPAGYVDCAAESSPGNGYCQEPKTAADCANFTSVCSTSAGATVQVCSSTFGYTPSCVTGYKYCPTSTSCVRDIGCTGAKVFDACANTCVDSIKADSGVTQTGARLAKFITATTVGDSVLSESGTLLTANGADLLLHGASRTFYLTNGGAAQNNAVLTVDQSGIGGYAGMQILGNNSSSNWPNLGFTSKNSGGSAVLGASITGQPTGSAAGSETMDLVLATKPSGGQAREVLRLTNGGSILSQNLLSVDESNLNAGFLNQNGTQGNGLIFGSGSGEGIASKRTAGGNQYGLDFYTNFSRRMAITWGGVTTVYGPSSDIEYNSDEGPRLLLRNPKKTGLGNEWAIYNMTGAYGDSLQFWNYGGAGWGKKMGLTDGGDLSVAGRVALGSTAVDYAPSGGNWNYDLLLNSSSTSSIGFHDSGESVSSIRYSNAGFVIGADDGWGVKNTSMIGNVGIGTTSPSAKLSVVASGAELAGSTRSATFLTSSGALGTTAGSELALASIGFSSSNNEELGIRARRVSTGTDWTTTAISLGIDVDNTLRVNGTALTLGANGAVSLGSNSVSADSAGAVALGYGAYAGGDHSISGGFGTSTYGDSAVSLGKWTDAEGAYSIALGWNSSITWPGTGSSVIGYNNFNYAAKSHAIGENVTINPISGSSTTVGNNIGIGTNITVGVYNGSTNYAMAIGHGMSSNYLYNGTSNSLAIGFNSNVPTLYVGPAGGTTGSVGNVGIGTTSPGYRLSVNGDVGMVGNNVINNGSPTAYFQDTDHRSAMIHVNSNIFYVLRGSGNNSLTWQTDGSGRWPLEINLENNAAVFGGNVEGGNVNARAGMYATNSINSGTGFGAGSGYVETKYHLAGQSGVPVCDQSWTWGGYSFSADGCYDTGMFSSADGDLRIANNGTMRYHWTMAGSFAYNSNEYSDRRIKQDIQPYVDGLAVLRNVRPVSYTYNGLAGSPKGEHEYGVVAQEVQKFMPYAIKIDALKLHPEDEETTDMLAVDMKIFPLLAINAIKELDAATLKLGADGTVTVPGDLSAESNRWGSAAPEVSCKTGEDCECPDGMYITKFRPVEGGAVVTCHKL